MSSKSADAVAGERTWTIYVCAKCGRPHQQGRTSCIVEFDPAGDELASRELVEVVELSRLRAAEEERERALQSKDEAMLELSREVDAQIAAQKQARLALAERDRLALDRGRLTTALAWLVDLKDGPRNAAYEEQKPRAWSLAREALASLEQKEDG